MNNKVTLVLFVLICTTGLLVGCGEDKTREKEVIDMTQMSGNVIYGEVFAMMSEPEEYLGKTIRIKGVFQTQKQESSGREFFFVLIVDAQACCQQGIELKGEDEAPPKGLPSPGEEMVVEGEFGKYKENGQDYYSIFVEKITDPK